MSYLLSTKNRKPYETMRSVSILFSDGSSGSLCRWFSSFSFLVSACGSVRHRSLNQVLKLEDFPKSTNWWWVKHTLNIAGNTKPHNWCVPCAFSIHASATYLDQLNQLAISLTRLHPWPVRASTVTLGIFWFALVLPVKAKSLEGSLWNHLLWCHNRTSFMKPCRERP